MRWRSGDTNTIKITVPSDMVVHIGDLVWLPSIARYGVAMQCSPDGNTYPIRVATSGCFEFPAVGEGEYATAKLSPTTTVERTNKRNLSIGKVIHNDGLSVWFNLYDDEPSENLKENIRKLLTNYQYLLQSL